MTNNPWKYFFIFYFRAWTAPNDDVALIFAEPTQVVIDVLENLIKKFAAIFFAFAFYHLVCFLIEIRQYPVPIPSSYGSTKLETPVPVRSLKLGNLGHG